MKTPMHESGSDERVVETLDNFLGFHCNFEQNGEICGKRIEEEGWITGCSHLFCYEHANAWFQNHDDCPLCRNGQVKLVRTDLSRAGAKKRGRVALVGMAPPEIIEAADTALNFWLDQKAHEFFKKGARQRSLLDHQRKIEGLVKERLGDAEAACSKLEAEQQMLHKKVSEVDREATKAEEEGKGLKKQLTATNEKYRSLQQRLAATQRASTRQEFFRRPLLQETPAPHPAFRTPNTAAAVKSDAVRSASSCRSPGFFEGSSLRHLSSNTGLTPFVGDGLERGDDACRFRGDSVGDRGPCHSDSRHRKDAVPASRWSSRPLIGAGTMTPGFMGASRVTRRRIS
eukprot:gnl/TRDRNA2_/TRDRNA2_80768_c0_seq1.p1 gnl/TRDRNA2_/TRDRNA2_80768_c0~~gnl/TRDRNA2_/TRDRNA2_80768_c0_seq1.p1  ORF type:complete len:343 (+),score=62.89 gnl/TRDRNA2_/TRDRNA2_80768_c0_seq1:79-1107(+)